jgi:Tfp pilus assembly protein PilO
MSTVREFRVPLLIGAGTLVVALLLWVALVSPQNSKLSGLQAQQTQLQSQQTALQGKLASLRTEQRKLSTSCADLQKITTQIPSVQSPTDVDAEESSFESQFNALAASTGVALSQFSGFAPATTTATAPAATTPSGSTPGVVAVPTNLTVTGTYSQMLAFVNGLDTFPRLFVIQKFVISFGAIAPVSAGATSASASSAAAPGAPPLWTGGTPTAPSAAPYNLAITGSIYYTSTPSALAACTKAIEVSK